MGFTFYLISFLTIATWIHRSLGTRPVNTHTVFVEDETEKRSLNLAKRFDTTQEMLGRTSNRPKLELLKAPEQTSQLSGLEVDESALKVS